MTIRVGINLLAIKPAVSGGADYYCRNLVEALSRLNRDTAYYLFLTAGNREYFDVGDPRFVPIVAPIGGNDRMMRVVWEQLWLPRITARCDIDVLHSPTYTWPVLCRTAGVVTIHDMLYERLPGAIDLWKRRYWRLAVPAGVRRCQRVLTPSQASKADIVSALGVNPARVSVTPCALPSDFRGLPLDDGAVDETLRKHGIRRPYLLSVGAFAPHKDTRLVIRALSDLRHDRSTAGLGLVLTGPDNGSLSELRREAMRHGTADRCHFLGLIDRAELSALYRGASAYVSAARMEGFGFPVLEAMEHQLPVVCSDAGALPEVTGDAALRFKAGDGAALRAALLRLMGDAKLRQRLVEEGRKRVRHFSWTETAELTHIAYEEASREYSTNRGREVLQLGASIQG